MVWAVEGAVRECMQCRLSTTEVTGSASESARLLQSAGKGWVSDPVVGTLLCYIQKSIWKGDGGRRAHSGARQTGAVLVCFLLIGSREV